MKNDLSRRDFILASGAAGLGLAVTGIPYVAQGRRKNDLRVLCIGVVGTIGGTDRKQVASHPSVSIAGLCDIDEDYLAEASAEHPDAFRCKDYRVAFSDHLDQFDAVIVATPDHSHASIMLMALANNKHVYGQKPLVHQLEEIVLIERAMAAKPDLVTQVGNQRMVYPGRRAAVDILKSGVLGRAIEAHAWTSSPGGDYYFNFERVLEEPSTPPPTIDFDLWLGPAQEQSYRELLMPRKWRSWWDFGTGGLGDWGVHLLDVVFYAYPELQSPFSVRTHAPSAANIFHTYPCQSTVTYAVASDRFARRVFPIYYNDRSQAPSRASLGLPGDTWADGNMTVVVCEGGVLTLTPGGDLEIWRDGTVTPGLEMPGLPEYRELNHWHAWVDSILGNDTELWTPFVDGARMTEACLLAVKASRFPGQELLWDKASLSFTNHEEATSTIVKRNYREGFAPPVVG